MNFRPDPDLYMNLPDLYIDFYTSSLNKSRTFSIVYLDRLLLDTVSHVSSAASFTYTSFKLRRLNKGPCFPYIYISLCIMYLSDLYRKHRDLFKLNLSQISIDVFNLFNDLLDLYLDLELVLILF